MKTITPEIRPAYPVAPPPPLASRASIDLRIDAVVFDGFSRAEANRASAALQQELTRLITVEGLPKFARGLAESRSDQLTCGSIPAIAERPELTGLRAARALHGGLRA